MSDDLILSAMTVTNSLVLTDERCRITELLKHTHDWTHWREGTVAGGIGGGGHVDEREGYRCQRCGLEMPVECINSPDLPECMAVPDAKRQHVSDAAWEAHRRLYSRARNTEFDRHVWEEECRKEGTMLVTVEEWDEASNRWTKALAALSGANDQTAECLNMLKQQDAQLAALTERCRAVEGENVRLNRMPVFAELRRLESKLDDADERIQFLDKLLQHSFEDNHKLQERLRAAIAPKTEPKPVKVATQTSAGLARGFDLDPRLGAGDAGKER